MLLYKDLLSYAKSINIDICGVSSTNVDHTPYYERLNTKAVHDHLYHNHHLDLSDDLGFSSLVVNAQTIISIGLNYNHDFIKSNNINDGHYSKISHGLDYHQLMNEKLNLIISFLLSNDQQAKFYSCCDTGVLDDRYCAYLCGNGFYGRNSMLINETYGSMVIYGTIITDLKISDYPHDISTTSCLNCHRCELRCPTHSLKDYQLNYHTCLSYLSQSKQMIASAYLSDCFYGCDLCNDVCPYNKMMNNNANLIDQGYYDLYEFIMLNKKDYLQYFGNKSMSWLNYHLLKKNAILLYVKQKKLSNDEIKLLKNEVLTKFNSPLLIKTFKFLLKEE
jgi:epoxyqueuosine reductase